MNISSLPEGILVGDKNAILNKIGEGQSGVVYLAVDQEKNRDVALKFLKKTEKNYDAKSRRFKEEYQKQLIGRNHSNIAQVYQFGYFEKHFFFTSEYVSGFDICTTSSGLTSYDEIAKLFIEIFEGLDFIHRSGLLHLDIKAENVIVKTDGGRKSVKILDFGISALAGDDVRFAGTPHYIAPEVVFRQKNKIDARADLFSAAVLMYYCLTGEFPFEEREKAIDLKSAAEIIAKEKAPAAPASFVKEIPEYLSAIVMRLLAKEPADRFYPNARAVVNALQIKQPDAFGTKGCEPYLRPIGNKHIGRVELQSELQEAIKELSEGKQPAIFCVKGGYGLGKSHLLMKLKESASQFAESIYVSEVAFPADDAMLARMHADLQREMEENKRSVLILADDVQECGGEMLKSLIDSINERRTNPKLYEGIKPIMLVMASDEDTTVAEHSSVIAQSPPSLSGGSALPTGQAGAGARQSPSHELQRLNKVEVEEYLQSTPAFKGKKIPAKWLDHFYWITSGIPLELAANLEQMDSAKMIFGLDGEIIVPAVEEPSVNLTSWRGEPKATKDRLIKQYNKLGPLEREVINFISVWDHRHVAKSVTEDDIADFFYSASIIQILNNLVDKGVLKYTLAFTNPYMQRVVYEQLAQEDREVIHDTIANYLKEDEEGILLHRGYGTFSTISLVLLSQRRIRNRGDLTLAIELLKDALTLYHPEQPADAKDLLLKAYIQVLLIECYTNAGRYAEAEALFNSALKNLDSAFFTGMRTWKAQLYRRVIPAMIQQGKVDAAETQIKECYQLLKPSNVLVRCIIKNSEGYLAYQKYFNNGAIEASLLEQAKNIFHETLQLEKNLPQPNRSRVFNNEIGSVYLVEGDYQKAMEAFKEKFQKHKKEKNVFGEISTAVRVANACQLLGDFGGAEEFARHSLALAKLSGLSKWALTSHRILANILHDSGDFQGALAENNKCLSKGVMLENINEWADIKNQIFVQMGYSYKWLKETNKAMLFFEGAIGAGVKGHYEALANLGLGEVFAETGDIKKAKDCWVKAEKIISTLPLSLKSSCEEKLKKLATFFK
jgi:serine/threonine protein kinase